MYYMCQTESGNVRIRSAPSLTAEVIGKCIRGNVYQSDTIVNGDGKQWLLIDNGYACTDYFVPQAVEEYPLYFTCDELIKIRDYIDEVLKE